VVAPGYAGEIARVKNQRSAATTRCAMFSLILKRASASHLSSD
jgi:hypothetical protein